MTTIDRPLPGDLAMCRGAHTHLESDVAQAERLIEDLAALVDAGLVVVHDRLLGPARYGLGPDLGDVA
jgi:hypothetical protein